MYGTMEPTNRDKSYSTAQKFITASTLYYKYVWSYWLHVWSLILCDYSTDWFISPVVKINSNNISCGVIDWCSKAVTTSIQIQGQYKSLVSNQQESTCRYTKMWVISMSVVLISSIIGRLAWGHWWVSTHP